jgi:hypothetical protein
MTVMVLIVMMMLTMMLLLLELLLVERVEELRQPHADEAWRDVERCALLPLLLFELRLLSCGAMLRISQQYRRRRGGYEGTGAVRMDFITVLAVRKGS